MPLHRLVDDPPPLQEPVLIASFDGWVDAAEAASSAVGLLAAEATLVATFDPDAIFDYRSRRPVLDVVDGRLSALHWPELAIRHTEMGGRDLLVFTGAEPDLRWRELADDVAALCTELGVAQWISIGSVPGAVAHTMPVPVMTTASALEMSVSGAGIPAVGFFAQVPPYASIGYAAASIALLDRVAGHLEIDIPMEGLREEEREQLARYDAAVRSDAMLKQTVEQLENVAGGIDEERLPSGDDLAREIQRFLRGRAETGEADG
jgi:hypothetical protein